MIIRNFNLFRTILSIAPGFLVPLGRHMVHPARLFTLDQVAFSPMSP